MGRGSSKVGMLGSSAARSSRTRSLSSVEEGSGVFDSNERSASSE